MTLAPRLSATAVALLAPLAGAQTPADTYFSLAVSEDSHNHVGAAKLFLDFQQAPFGVPDAALGVVISTEVAPGARTLDGDAAEWDPALLTTVAGVVQSNYPLSEYLDGVPTALTVGSSWDATYVYFLVQWEDAGHTASTRASKWIFGDQGGGEVGWNSLRNVGATPGAPNAGAINASGHVLAGNESEDRVFLMFPIVDAEGNYTPSGLGCAMYCHANLDEDFPWQNYTGDGVVAMGANLAGDRADIWHWKATRTAPSGYADDKWLDVAVGSANGRKNDAGSAAYVSNPLAGGAPTWMHTLGLSWLGDALFDVDAVPYSGSALPGDELPSSVSQAPAGSRGDVRTAASYDPLSGRWTLELRRLRDTGNADDHSFEGASAAPPVNALALYGDPLAGQALYAADCAVCHFAGGVGLPDLDYWPFPRVQRASGSLIAQAIATIPIMAPLIGQYGAQDIEDVAAYLQTQATFLPTRTLDVAVVGSGTVFSSPVGLVAPGADQVSWIDGTPVTLTAVGAVGWAFAGWSGPCSDATPVCSFTLGADTTAVATFVLVGPGDVFCAGDGSGTACPCGNDNDGSVRGGLAGCANGASPGGAALYASGSASATAADLVLLAEGVPAGQPGLFLQGDGQVAGGAGQVFGDGLRCTGTNVVRLQVVFADGAGALATSVDLVAKGGIAAGATKHYQLWYRDPATSLCGNRHSLSNGYTVVWQP
ncbi:MAG: c-type cytochrome [Planctomycetes bacterium]|nr:c-type cytochrome [Planctomycetota bacterium]